MTTQDGTPLAAATIFEKGKKASAVSKEDGAFTITISSGNAVLIASYVGYETRAIAVNGQKYVAIILIPTPLNLDDLVVIGYGTARKKDLTGAVASVQEKDFNKGFFTSPDQLLQGKVSGVQITTDDGSPGGAATIRIRGNSAITGTGQPLFVVDGVPLDGRSLEKILIHSIFLTLLILLPSMF